MLAKKKEKEVYIYVREEQEIQRFSLSMQSDENAKSLVNFVFELGCRIEATTYKAAKQEQRFTLVDIHQRIFYQNGGRKTNGKTAFYCANA